MICVVEYLNYFKRFAAIQHFLIASKEPLISGRVIDYYWFRYIIPPVEVERRTLIAVNVGGAVIPVLLSGYLFTEVDFPDLLLAVFLMTVFMHMLARPVMGLGIAVPALLPPIMAALLALIISPGQAPIIAYISGTLGSLIGAIPDRDNLGTPDIILSSYTR